MIPIGTLAKVLLRDHQGVRPAVGHDEGDGGAFPDGVELFRTIEDRSPEYGAFARRHPDPHQLGTVVGETRTTIMDYNLHVVRIVRMELPFETGMNTPLSHGSLSSQRQQ